MSAKEAVQNKGYVCFENTFSVVSDRHFNNSNAIKLVQEILIFTDCFARKIVL